MRDIVKFLNEAPSRRLSPDLDDGNDGDKILSSLRKTQVHEVITAYRSMCSLHDDTAWGVVLEQGASIRASVDAYLSESGNEPAPDEGSRVEFVRLNGMVGDLVYSPSSDLQPKEVCKDTVLRRGKSSRRRMILTCNQC